MTEGGGGEGDDGGGLDYSNWQRAYHTDNEGDLFLVNDDEQRKAYCVYCVSFPCLWLCALEDHHHITYSRARVHINNRTSDDDAA